jgi:hypothetical protein
MATWKSRLTDEVTYEVPEDLLANPMNARRHPGAQRDALRGSLDELGWVYPILVNDFTGRVVDGHARIEEAISKGEAVVPVLHCRLTEEEEALALAVLDPITNMAIYDEERLNDLIAAVTTGNDALNDLLASLSGENVDAAPIHVPPPSTTKTVILRYEEDEFAEVIGALSLCPGRDPSDKVLRLLRSTIG